MLARRIQSRIFVKLGIASVVASAVVFIVLAVVVQKERRAERVQEAELLLGLILGFESGGNLQADLDRLAAQTETLSGAPRVFLWANGRSYVGKSGTSLAPWLVDEIFEAPMQAFRLHGYIYCFGANGDTVPHSQIRAIVRFEDPRMFDSIYDRYGILFLVTSCLMFALGTYAIRFQNRSVFGPLADFVDRIERRIEGISGSLVEREGEFDEIQRLFSRYEELVDVIEAQGNELRRHGAELRQLLDALPAYVWYKDDKNNIIRVNKSGAESVGLSIEELEGKSVHDVFPEEADAYYQDDLSVIDSGKAKLGYIETYTPAKGKARTIRTDKIPYVDQYGKVTGVVALVTDISELVDLQEERRVSERLIRRLVEIGNWEVSNVDERIEASLKDTCEALGLKTGIFSEISDSSYVIRRVYDELGMFSAGDVFALEDVYCNFVVVTGRSVASNHMAETKWAKLACYKKVKRESYIAAPVRLDGKITGTINFSAPEKRAKPFTQFEIDAVRVIARWVEGLLRQQQINDRVNRQSAELRLILDTTPSQIWFKNDENRILRANRAAAESIGLKVEEVEGKSAKELFPYDAEQYFQEDVSILESGAPKFGAIRPYVSKKGRTHWTRYDKLPYQLESGQRGIISVVSDITELVESQNAMKVAEERFRMAVEASPVGMLIVDSDLRITLVNNEAERIFGYAREELLWRPVFRYLGDRIVVALNCLFDAEERIRSEVPLGSDGEFLAIRKDSLEVPVEVVLSTYSLADDSYAMVSIFDISARVESQRALHDSEERFQLAATGASVGIWDWFDIEGNREWWSPKFYELLGYRMGDLEPTLETFKSLLHPDDVEGTLAAVDRCFKDGSIFTADYRLLCESGEYKWFLGSGMVSFDDSGEPRRMTGTIQDIDDRKRAEQELSKVVSDLQRANEELSNFAFLSSHDLQEPLRTISSFLTLLKDNYGSQLDEDANEYMDFTLEGVSRLQNMIRSLLQYCRLDSKQCIGSEFSIGEAVQLGLSDLRQRIAERKVIVEVQAEFPKVFGDMNQISLVFQNLFSNAIKFNQSDCPKIVVSYSVQSSDEIGKEGIVSGDFVVVAVADNGIGIREKYMKRIFSIFQKLHPNGEYEGSGIGLSMVQKIMQGHGGIVWLESEMGDGTSFYLAFPIKP